MDPAGVSIRPARRDEWERVRELRLRSLKDAPDAFGSILEEELAYAESEWLAWIEGWEGATNVLYVAEFEDEWAGMAVGSRTAEETSAHLYAMWVDPAWRTRGVGSSLVEDCSGGRDRGTRGG